MNPAISTFKDSAIPDYALRILNATQYPQAVCLDGTQGAYYHRPALSGSAANKWRIFFQGGGWCVSDEDCYGRSQTPLGSNLNLTATAVDPAGYCGSSFLSGDPADAPGFWDWHAVYVPYCDGGSMTGKNETRTIVNVRVCLLYRRGILRHRRGIPAPPCRVPRFTTKVALSATLSSPTSSLLPVLLQPLISLSGVALPAA